MDIAKDHKNLTINSFVPNAPFQNGYIGNKWVNKSEIPANVLINFIMLPQSGFAGKIPITNSIIDH